MATTLLNNLPTVTIPGATDIMLIEQSGNDSKITVDALMSYINSLEIGIIKMYGGATAPSGYVMCDGSSLDRTAYANLFAVISTTYGSADSTHFNVPDIRGIFPKGAGTTNRTLGKDAAGNFYAGTLGAYNQDQIQGFSVLPDAGRNFASFSAGSIYNSGTAGGDTTGTNVSNDGTHGVPRLGYTTEPANIGVNFIIKY
jgi:hypothetical protein